MLMIMVHVHDVMWFWWFVGEIEKIRSELQIKIQLKKNLKETLLLAFIEMKQIKVRIVIFPHFSTENKEKLFLFAESAL